LFASHTCSFAIANPVCFDGYSVDRQAVSSSKINIYLWCGGPSKWPGRSAAPTDRCRTAGSPLAPLQDVPFLLRMGTRATPFSAMDKVAAQTMPRWPDHGGGTRGRAHKQTAKPFVLFFTHKLEPTRSNARRGSSGVGPAFPGAIIRHARSFPCVLWPLSMAFLGPEEPLRAPSFWRWPC
jgi:hypothetical protein